VYTTHSLISLSTLHTNLSSSHSLTTPTPEYNLSFRVALGEGDKMADESAGGSGEGQVAAGAPPGIYT